MRVIWSDLYDRPAVVAEPGDTAHQVIDRCHEVGAVRETDRVEYVVQLHEVGPKLWTDLTLHRSLPLDPDGETPFRHWLRGQRENYDDPVGDLARDVFSDPLFP